MFRAQFHKMCSNCGVDPLASNKGFWAELLGFGDFYYELGVQIVEACLSSRPQNGGLCELRHLMEAVLKRRGGAAAPVSEAGVVLFSWSWIERAVCVLLRLGFFP